MENEEEKGRKRLKEIILKTKNVAKMIIKNKEKRIGKIATTLTTKKFKNPYANLLIPKKKHKLKVI